MPKEIKDEVKRYKLKWTLFGKYIVEDYYQKRSEVFGNHFFVMYSEGKRVFNMQDRYDNEND
jgi:hypothetical protein